MGRDCEDPVTDGRCVLDFLARSQQMKQGAVVVWVGLPNHDRSPKVREITLAFCEPLANYVRR
jgi:hypothetical protein